MSRVSENFVDTTALPMKTKNYDKMMERNNEGVPSYIRKTDESLDIRNKVTKGDPFCSSGRKNNTKQCKQEEYGDAKSSDELICDTTLPKTWNIKRAPQVDGEPYAPSGGKKQLKRSQTESGFNLDGKRDKTLNS